MFLTIKRTNIKSLKIIDYTKQLPPRFLKGIGKQNCLGKRLHDQKRKKKKIKAESPQNKAPYTPNK